MMRLHIILLLILQQQVIFLDAFAPKLSLINTSKQIVSDRHSKDEQHVVLSMSDESNNNVKRNIDRPELPEIPGDYDWDVKYANDPDWQTERVPGKMTLNEIDLARQATSLGDLEEKWRKQRIQEEYEASINVGWVPTAELANGRTAMFFLVTGLLTEYWTGVSLPGQIEELLRVVGVIGFGG
jgi:hypothetical protein